MPATPRARTRRWSARETARAAPAPDRGAVGVRRIENQTVGPDSGMPVAQFACQRSERTAARIVFADVEEIVAVGVSLGETHRQPAVGSRVISRQPVIFDRMPADATQ